MKTISAPLDTHLAAEEATLAVCVKATRQDGQIFGFTTLDIDIPFESVTYEANGAFIGRTNVASSAQMNVDDMEFSGVTSSVITEADLRNGVWDNCEIRMFVVNYKSLGDGAVKMARGRLGNVSIGRYSFQAELRRMLQAYSQTLLKLHTPECDADFCDARCGLNSDDYSLLYKVKTVQSQDQFEIEPADRATLDTNSSLTVINPGAETGDLTGWTTVLGTPAVDSGIVYAGTYSFWLNDSGGSAISQTIDLVSEGLSTTDIDAERVLMTLKARLYSTGQGRCLSNMTFYDTSMVLIGRPHQTMHDSDSYPWALVELTGVIPTLCRHIKIQFHGDSSFGTPSSRVDEVTFDATIITSGQKYALSITNPGAETGDTSGWTTAAGYNALTTTGTNVWEGSYKFIGNGSSREYQDFTVLDYLDIENIDSANSSIVLKWFQGTNTYPNEGYLFVEFFDSASVSLGTYQLNSENGVLHTYSSVTSWYESGFVAPLPKNTRTVRVYIHATTSNVFFDSIEGFFYTGSGDTITYQHTTDDYYLYGLATFLDGNNSSLSREVIEHDGTTKRLRLFVAPHYTINIGDLVNILRGCDQLLITCRDDYANIINFRGYPYMPLDLPPYPDAQS